MMRTTPILFAGAMTLFAGAMTLTGCIAEAPSLEEQRWEQVWSDEFNGAAESAPGSDWVYDIGTGTDGWGNNELQYYSDRTENVRLDGDGNLVITARRESFEGQAWTSARLKTKEQFEFLYGRVEANIQLPVGKGLWPAFWMLGNDIDEVIWPGCGEIDVMENFARSTTEVAGTIHGPGYSGGDAFGEDYTFPEGEDITGFHVYRIDWDPEHIAWYVDDVLYHTAHPGDVSGPWVLDHPFFMLLNLAVGGNPVEDPDDTTPDINEMRVDWVRVSERRLSIPDPGLELP